MRLSSQSHRTHVAAQQLGISPKLLYRWQEAKRAAEVNSSCAPTPSERAGIGHFKKALASLPGERFDNILLTLKGLRLTDAGLSVLQRQVGESFFNAHV